MLQRLKPILKAKVIFIEVGASSRYFIYGHEEVGVDEDDKRYGTLTVPIDKDPKMQIGEIFQVLSEKEKYPYIKGRRYLLAGGCKPIAVLSCRFIPFIKIMSRRQDR